MYYIYICIYVLYICIYVYVLYICIYVYVRIVRVCYMYYDLSAGLKHFELIIDNLYERTMEISTCFPILVCLLERK